MYPTLSEQLAKAVQRDRLGAAARARLVREAREQQRVEQAHEGRLALQLLNLMAVIVAALLLVGLVLLGVFG